MSIAARDLSSYSSSYSNGAPPFSIKYQSAASPSGCGSAIQKLKRNVLYNGSVELALERWKKPEKWQKLKVASRGSNSEDGAHYATNLRIQRSSACGNRKFFPPFRERSPLNISAEISVGG
jgi:hypothetical protein